LRAFESIRWRIYPESYVSEHDRWAMSHTYLGMHVEAVDDSDRITKDDLETISRPITCTHWQDRISCRTVNQMLCKQMVLYIYRLRLSLSPVGMSVFMSLLRNTPVEPIIQVPELHAANQKKFPKLNNSLQIAQIRDLVNLITRWCSADVVRRADFVAPVHSL
jgi:hypothetical protein